MSTLLKSRSSRRIASLGGMLLALSVGTAAAQVYPRDVIAHCARMVQKMPELRCTTCDTFRDRMELACEANGGRIPGSRTIFGSEPFDRGPTAEDRRVQ